MLPGNRPLPKGILEHPRLGRAVSETTEPPILGIEPHQHPFSISIFDLIDDLRWSRKRSNLGLGHTGREWSAKLLGFNCCLLFVRHTRSSSELFDQRQCSLVEVLVKPGEALVLLAFEEEPNVGIPPEALDVDIDEAGVLHHEADGVK